MKLHERPDESSLIAEVAKARAAASRSRRRAAEMALHLRRTALRLHEELARHASTRPRNLAMEDRLRAAVACHGFELRYQPIVDVEQRRVCALEALVRWCDEGTWVPPSDFVPLAETNGLIAPLGEWILGQACRQIRQWQLAGLEVPPVAVNLSPCQLHEPDLVDRFLGTLRDAAIEPECVELEITETSLMQDIEHTLPKLQGLAANGVRLAVDDFGTGYSSLSYLRKLPISKLKVDQSFVRGLDEDCNDKIIMSAVIGLAKDLGLTTVAEGVERRQQLDVLCALGCEQFQGYYFGRPARAEAVGALLPRREPFTETGTDFDALSLLGCAAAHDFPAMQQRTAVMP